MFHSIQMEAVFTEQITQFRVPKKKPNGNYTLIEPIFIFRFWQWNMINGVLVNRNNALASTQFYFSYLNLVYKLKSIDKHELVFLKLKAVVMTLKYYMHWNSFEMLSKRQHFYIAVINKLAYNTYDRWRYSNKCWKVRYEKLVPIYNKLTE